MHAAGACRRRDRREAGGVSVERQLLHQSQTPLVIRRQFQKYRCDIEEPATLTKADGPQSKSAAGATRTDQRRPSHYMDPERPVAAADVSA